MNIESWVNIVLAILSGIVTAIPLVVKLVNVVKDATKTKNWNQLIRMTVDYMTQAEKNFTNGAARKEWVLTMVQTSAVTVNYDLTEDDIQKISDLIDALCDASKILNNEAEKQAALKAAQEAATK